jgi:hypothetical protein
VMKRAANIGVGGKTLGALVGVFQGDQIGRIFAYWAKECFENCRCSLNFWATVSPLMY